MMFEDCIYVSFYFFERVGSEFVVLLLLCVSVLPLRCCNIRMDLLLWSFRKWDIVVGIS
jgi:hypothetical protein